MKSKKGRPSLNDMREDLNQLRDPVLGKKRVKDSLIKREKDLETYLSPWYRFSKESEHVYPSQGLLRTSYDFLDESNLQMLPQEMMVKTLRMRRFFLELYNHPYRIHYLDQINKLKFEKIPKVKFPALETASARGVALSIGDMAASVIGDTNQRISRRERYSQGPFVKLGRQARIPFTGSASPDVWNSAAAIATMAASHGLSTVPRNGLLSDVDRQADVAKETLGWLDSMADEILVGRGDKNKVLGYWKNNVMGTLEASPDKALERAEKLFKVGVRSFRIYSPEPGTGVTETTKSLRAEYGEKVELFSGQIVSIRQAKEVEEAGADGVFVGIGGGGRCITGVRSGSAIDWPELVWNLRGEISVPVVVEGGGSDHIATTLLLGATGIGTSRVVAGGTVESPGGALYCVDKEGKLFKPYGGEASARAKFLDGKLLPFEIPSFVEGETRPAVMSYMKYVYPTLTYNLHLLIEDAILSLVFRGSEDVASMQAIDPSPLRRITSIGDFQRGTH